MRHDTCEIDDSMPRELGTRMLVVSIAIAATTLLIAWMDSPSRSPMVTAGILAAVGLAGGLALRDKARVPGLPLIAAAIIAVSLLLATALGGSQVATGGGLTFMALLVSSTASRRVPGLVATLILAVAQILAAIV